MIEYQVKFETVTVNKIPFTIRSLKDRIQFSDPLGEAEKAGICSAAWSLFGIIWPSGRVLAKVMSTQVVNGKRILEVGCGLALSSIVLHQRGADITANDYHPLAAAFLSENLTLNNLPPISFHTGNWSETTPLPRGYDLIIGSDILYEPDHAEILSKFIHRQANKHAEVILVDPCRGNHAKFNKKMRRLGFSLTEKKLDDKETSGVLSKGRMINYQR